MKLDKAQRKLREARKLIQGAHHDAPVLQAELKAAAEAVSAAENRSAELLRERVMR